MLLINPPLFLFICCLSTLMHFTVSSKFLLTTFFWRIIYLECSNIGYYTIKCTFNWYFFVNINPIILIKGKSFFCIGFIFLIKTRTSRSFKVSNWDILEFRNQFEIRTFIFQNTLDYGTLINKEIESISNNFDVLCWNSLRCCPRSSPDSWIRFLFYKTCR